MTDDGRFCGGKESKKRRKDVREGSKNGKQEESKLKKINFKTNVKIKCKRKE